MLAVTTVVVASTIVVMAGSSPIASASHAVVRPCEAVNLVGAFVSHQVATGHVVTTVAFTNVGTSTCELGGYPSLVGLRGTKQFKLHLTGHGTYGGDLRPAALAPRMSGALIISTGDLCGPYYGVIPPGHSYSSLLVILPNDEGSVKVLGATLDTTCGLFESQLGWRNHFSIRGV
jgi:hypothetical protein